MTIQSDEPDPLSSANKLKKRHARAQFFVATLKFLLRLVAFARAIDFIYKHVKETLTHL